MCLHWRLAGGGISVCGVLEENLPEGEELTDNADQVNCKACIEWMTVDAD